MKITLRLVGCLCLFLVGSLVRLRAASLMENLGRGVVAVRASSTDVYVGWRVLGTDSGSIAFNLYRSTDGGPAVRLNASLLTTTSDFTDTTANLAQANAYFVRPVVGGVEGAASASFTLPASAPVQQFLSVPLQIPANGVTPGGAGYAYTANDCSVADLDGDGEYEIVVKWDPTNSKDNSQAGYTGNVFLDAYKANGTRLWRIDLGRNIRAGAHYTQFLVYDFDGDGRAELVCKTAPNTKDGAGAFIGQPGKFLGTPTASIDHNADYRNGNGYVLTGPEFFTVFDGLTGAELATTNYVVPRNNNPASGDVTAWGDDYGNRVDRFLACVAYLDGQRPSFVLCRGYYTRAVLAAWDWRNGQLTPRWVFDTSATPALSGWRGQGAHSLAVGDVDGDGRDEITYGAAAIDDDGSGLYSTQLGHGDALHLSDMDPTRPGQEVWMVHEDPGSYGSNGLEFRDARTGALIYGVGGQGADVGRGVAGDIDPRYLGYEMWGARGGLHAANGTPITSARPGQMNFMVWWDGDLLREILDGTRISKWDWNSNTSVELLTATGASSNNSTKANPALSADILGDWREEVIWRAADSTELRIYTTTAPASNRLFTLMHDRQYRLAIAWQNVGYNQPPHPSFYLGEGMSAPPAPDIVTSLAALPSPAPAVTSINRYDPATPNTGATSVTFRVTFNQPVTGVDPTDFTVTRTGSVTGSVSSATAQSGVAYSVTVGSITGTGTIRLDLKSSGTGIVGAGGAPVSGGFTSGQVYNRATLAWINPASGGLWSNPANWDGGVIASGVGAVPIFGNFDLTANNTVVLDTPRTVSGLTFGDTNAASAASWTISDGGAGNALTLDPVSGLPANTVNTLGAGAMVTLDVPLAGDDGMAKAGAGTLVLAKPATLTGQVNVSGGTLRLGTGGALSLGGGTVSLTGLSTLSVAGGSLATSGLVTAGTGTLVIDGGAAALNGGFRTNSDFGSTLRLNSGTLTATDVNIRRNGAATVDFNSGFIVTGGTANVGTIWLGNSNSTGAMSVDGGTVTATGMITIGNNSGSSRGGGMRVRGGNFTSTEAVNGIVLTRASGNVTSATFSGGVSTVEKFTFGLSSSVTAGSGALTLSGGTLYLGAGGLVRNASATGTYAANIALNGGTLGAKASWATTLPLALGGAVVIKAAGADDAPANLALNGVLSGTGGFAKTGGGTLMLAAANTFAGAVDVEAGTLRVMGGIASGGAFDVRTGGTLAGNGTIQRTVTLAGGTIAPDGTSAAATISATALTWETGSMRFDLGASGDRLALSGAFTKAGSGSYAFEFVPDATLMPGVYTLVAFGSTNFVVSDFTATGLPTGLAGRFQVTPTELRVIVYGPPVIQSAVAASGTFGAPFSYAIVATEAPTSFGATGLPPGLAIDSASGVIAGTPAAAGMFNVTLRATNAAGTGTAPLTLTVAKAVAPIVVGSPAGTPTRAFYTGTAHAATAATTPAGLNVTFTYNGDAAAPALPGTYTVVGTVNDANYEGTGTGTLIIMTTALVRHAPLISGSVTGSVHVLLAEDLALNGDISSDLLVPGSPAVVVNGQPTFVGTRDGNGAADPSAHVVTLNGGAVVRYIVRRVDPIALPVVPAPQPAAGSRDVVLNNANQSARDLAGVRNLTINGSAGEVALPAGAYGRITANGSSTLVLGAIGATTPAIYDLQELALNGTARLELAGPVRLRLDGDVTLASSAGVAAHPGWLTLELAAGNVTLNGSATVHGEIVAPAGTVTLTGHATLRGRVTADRLVINGNALLEQAEP